MQTPPVDAKIRASRRNSSFVVVGCGRFGSRAAHTLRKRYPLSKITVVDQDQRALRKVSRLSLETVVGKGRQYLEQSGSENPPFDVIIPAVPLHLAFEFIFSRLKDYAPKRSWVPILSGLPNAHVGETGDLYTSLADFLCPEACPEPPTYCMMTRKRRTKPLYAILGDLEGPFVPFVIRSQQLGPGVGGFESRLLTDLVKQIRAKIPTGPVFLVSTACRCHGVTSALTF